MGGWSRRRASRLLLNRPRYCCAEILTCLRTPPPRSWSAACASTGAATPARSAWRASGERPLRLSAILVTLSLLTGCSATRLAYDHADTWLRWRAGNYLDVHGEQAEELDERIDAFHD